MGCDIHSFAEVKKDGKWERITDALFKDYGDTMTTEPFGCRSYSIFGFLADVRNYSMCKPISDPKGLPSDSEWLNSPSEYAYESNPMNGDIIPYNERTTNKQELEEDWNYHSASWLTLKELLDFDYSQTFEDRRTTKTTMYPEGGKLVDGAALALEGQGEITTYRKHLGDGFFNDVAQLKTMGSAEDVRIVFWFDN